MTDLRVSSYHAGDLRRALKKLGVSEDDITEVFAKIEDVFGDIIEDEREEARAEGVSAGYEEASLDNDAILKEEYERGVRESRSARSDYHAGIKRGVELGVMGLASK